MNIRSAISKINKNGALLVFPIKNKKEPHSLWSEFYPRTKMLWEWTDDGDDKVADMWHLMKRLSDCKDVVYSKWYQGRATFFSRDLFRAILSIAGKKNILQSPLDPISQTILETLRSDSPLSTKQLKQMTDLQGKFNEPNYNRAMKNLFSKFLIVGFGEVDDGAFPSLAVGATQNIYEDLWNEAKTFDESLAQKIVDKFLPLKSSFRKQFDKITNFDSTTEPHING